MKTLGKLKLLTVSAFIVLGMSSCLKTENKFAIGAFNAYILQEGVGESARFKPEIQIQGNEPIKSAYATYKGDKYLFSALSGTNNYYMEFDPYMGAKYVDSIPIGTYAITATNADSKVAVTQVTFAGSKRLGNLDVTEFKYTGSTNLFSVKFNKVENASNYYIVYKASNSNAWQSLGRLSTVSGENELLSANLTVNLGEQTFKVAVGVICESLLKVGPTLTVTGGKDASL